MCNFYQTVSDLWWTDLCDNWVAYNLLQNYNISTQKIIKIWKQPIFIGIFKILILFWKMLICSTISRTFSMNSEKSSVVKIMLFAWNQIFPIYIVRGSSDLLAQLYRFQCSKANEKDRRDRPILLLYSHSYIFWSKYTPPPSQLSNPRHPRTQC